MSGTPVPRGELLWYTYERALSPCLFLPRVVCRPVQPDDTLGAPAVLTGMHELLYASWVRERLLLTFIHLKSVAPLHERYPGDDEGCREQASRRAPLFVAANDGTIWQLPESLDGAGVIPPDLFAFWRNDLEACLETIATRVARADGDRRSQTLASLASGVARSTEVPTRSPQRVALETVTDADLATPEAREATVGKFLKRLEDSNALTGLVEAKPKAGDCAVTATKTLIWRASGYDRKVYYRWERQSRPTASSKVFTRLLRSTPDEFVKMLRKKVPTIRQDCD